MSGVACRGTRRGPGRNRGPLTDPSHRSLVVGKSAMAVAVPAPAAPIVSLPVPGEGCDLLVLLAGVPDGRTGQGRDHPVAAVLALAAAAVVAGMKGYTAISGRVADVPPPVLAGLYLRRGAA